MNLILDIGNTRTKLGIFKGDELVEREIWEDWTLIDLQKCMERYPLIQRVAVSTVTYIWDDVEQFLKELFHYVPLTHQTPIPIINEYLTPETLGKDRLAAVIGAQHLFPETTCLVIDAGTCIKYDILLSNRRYLGGNICPGIQMRWKAMHQFTAKLPEVRFSDNLDLVGNNTETALQTGGQLGALMEMRAFIDAYTEKYGVLSVILTGGDAIYFADQLKTKIFVQPNLILIGLNKILNYNVEISK